MAFDGNESEQISLTTATSYTASFRQSHQGEVKAHFFGINKLQDILSQDDCVGIRVYYGIDGNGGKQLVLVGVDANEKDLYNGVILDKSIPCPGSCDSMSPLN